ncbi:hypothetical protein AFLA70_802g000210, partial [Aspergillus flavus AF70]
PIPTPASDELSDSAWVGLRIFTRILYTITPPTAIIITITIAIAIAIVITTLTFLYITTH